MDSFNLDALSFIFTIIVSIISCTWAVSSMKHRQEVLIKEVETRLGRKIDNIEYEHKLLVEKNNNSHDRLEYLYNDLKNALEHKTKRIGNMISDITKFLEKNNNFKSRGGFNSSEEET